MIFSADLINDETFPQGDEVTLVTPDDQVVGRMDKVAAHRYPVQLHRAVSVWLFRQSSPIASDTSDKMAEPELEVLLQQRSQVKITGADNWANTICGNVWPDEKYEACATRRLREELGIENVVLEPREKFIYKAFVNDEFGEFEVDQVFRGWFDGHVQPNPQEVGAYQWVKWSELVEQVRQALASLPAPWPLAADTAMTSDLQLKTQTVLLPVTLEKQSYLLLPWTVMMIAEGKISPPALT